MLDRSKATMLPAGARRKDLDAMDRFLRRGNPRTQLPYARYTVRPGSDAKGNVMLLHGGRLDVPPEKLYDFCRQVCVAKDVAHTNKLGPGSCSELWDVHDGVPMGFAYFDLDITSLSKIDLPPEDEDSVQNRCLDFAKALSRLAMKTVLAAWPAADTTANRAHWAENVRFMVALTPKRPTKIGMHIVCRNFVAHPGFMRKLAEIAAHDSDLRDVCMLRLQERVEVVLDTQPYQMRGCSLRMLLTEKMLSCPRCHGKEELRQGCTECDGVGMVRAGPDTAYEHFRMLKVADLATLDITEVAADSEPLKDNPVYFYSIRACPFKDGDGLRFREVPEHLQRNTTLWSSLFMAINEVTLRALTAHERKALRPAAGQPASLKQIVEAVFSEKSNAAAGISNNPAALTDIDLRNDANSTTINSLIDIASDVWAAILPKGPGDTVSTTRSRILIAAHEEPRVLIGNAGEDDAPPDACIERNAVGFVRSWGVAWLLTGSGSPAQLIPPSELVSPFGPGSTVVCDRKVWHVSAVGNNASGVPASMTLIRQEQEGIGGFVSITVSLETLDTNLGVRVQKIAPWKGEEVHEDGETGCVVGVKWDELSQEFCCEVLFEADDGEVQQAFSREYTFAPGDIDALPFTREPPGSQSAMTRLGDIQTPMVCFLRRTPARLIEAGTVSEAVVGIRQPTKAALAASHLGVVATRTLAGAAWFTIEWGASRIPEFVAAMEPSARPCYNGRVDGVSLKMACTRATHIPMRHAHTSPGTPIAFIFLDTTACFNIQDRHNSAQSHIGVYHGGIVLRCGCRCTKKTAGRQWGPCPFVNKHLDDRAHNAVRTEPSTCPHDIQVPPETREALRMIIRLLTPVQNTVENAIEQLTNPRIGDVIPALLPINPRGQELGTVKDRPKDKHNPVCESNYFLFRSGHPQIPIYSVPRAIDKVSMFAHFLRTNVDMHMPYMPSLSSLAAAPSPKRQRLADNTFRVRVTHEEAEDLRRRSEFEQ